MPVLAAGARAGRAKVPALRTAWWQRGRPEQTAHELLAALRASPGEVYDRPAIPSIAADLTGRHPRITGVRELAAATARRPGPATA